MVAEPNIGEISDHLGLTFQLWLLLQHLIFVKLELLPDQVRLVYVEIVACPVKPWRVQVKIQLLDVIQIINFLEVFIGGGRWLFFPLTFEDYLGWLFLEVLHAGCCDNGAMTGQYAILFWL